MKSISLGAFWRALLICGGAYLLFDSLFLLLNWLSGQDAPTLMPRSLMLMYMPIVVVAVLLYYAADEARWREFKQPMARLLRDPGMAVWRWVVLLGFAGLVAFSSFRYLQPDTQPPPQLRQAHPAPPSAINLYGKRMELEGLENPVRSEILTSLQADEASGWQQYDAAVQAGGELYYQNCFYCHGDLLDGKGHFAAGLSPTPASFLDPTIIPQLQESYLFWRIATGAQGMPREGAPWDSAMPAWADRMSERDIWKLLIFMYDYSGYVPSIWDPEQAKAVSAMQASVQARRNNLQGKPLYDLRCAMCHGLEGDGQAVAAEFMYPRPRDFTLGLFKYKESPGTRLPRDLDLFNAIKFGLPGTAMPGWQRLMSDQQIRSLIPVIKRFDESFSWAPEAAEDEDFDERGRYLKDDFISIDELEPATGRPPFNQASIEQGRIAYDKACKECHGEAGRGNILSGKPLKDDWGQRIWPRDLTQPWSYRWPGNWGAGDDPDEALIESIYRRVSIGIPGTPMPAHRALEAGNEDAVGLADRWHIAHFVYSLAQAGEPPGRQRVIFGQFRQQLPDDPWDPAWEAVEPTALQLVPNVIEDERLFTPLNRLLKVRVLFSEQELVFLLEANDRTESLPGHEYSRQLQDETLTLQPDAFAVQLPGRVSQADSVLEKPSYRHGERRKPTTIWYWNAGSVEPARAPRSQLYEARGLGRSLRPVDSIKLQANGEWRDGQWRVLMRRPRVGGGDELPLEAGAFIPLSFANWDGSNGERGSRHSFTGWLWLQLPLPVEPLRQFGLPALLFLLCLLAGGALFRWQANGPVRDRSGG